jgi:hypothetical protein
MSQAARRTHQFSIVRPGSRPADTPSNSSSLNEFFGGWLDSVAPELSSLQSNQAPTFPYRKYSISTTDLVRVNRATIREGIYHRHWPPEVVAQFLTAEVITRKNKRS